MSITCTRRTTIVGVAVVGAIGIGLAISRGDAPEALGTQTSSTAVEPTPHRPSRPH